jgi:hypothetical protein
MVTKSTPIAIREEDGRHKAVFKGQLRLISTGDRERDILLNTAKFTQMVEEVVRKYQSNGSVGYTQGG